MINRFLRRLLGIRYTPWLFVIVPLIVGGVRIIAEHAILYGLPAGQHMRPITGTGFLLQIVTFYVFV